MKDKNDISSDASMSYNNVWTKRASVDGGRRRSSWGTGGDLKRHSEWQTVPDPSSGRDYYCNSVTGQASWAWPPEGTAAQPQAATPTEPVENGIADMKAMQAAATKARRRSSALAKIAEHCNARAAPLMPPPIQEEMAAIAEDPEILEQTLMPTLKTWLTNVKLQDVKSTLDACGFIMLEDMKDLEFEDLEAIGLDEDQAARLWDKLQTHGPNIADLSSVPGARVSRQVVDRSAKSLWKTLGDASRNGGVSVLGLGSGGGASSEKITSPSQTGLNTAEPMLRKTEQQMRKVSIQDKGLADILKSRRAKVSTHQAVPVRGGAVSGADSKALAGIKATQTARPRKQQVELVRRKSDEEVAAGTITDSLLLEKINRQKGLVNMQDAARAFFNRFDVRKNALLDPDEFNVMLAQLHFPPDDFERMRKALDQDGDGNISFDEFFLWFELGLSAQAFEDMDHHLQESRKERAAIFKSMHRRSFEREQLEADPAHQTYAQEFRGSTRRMSAMTKDRPQRQGRNTRVSSARGIDRFGSDLDRMASFRASSARSSSRIGVSVIQAGGRASRGSIVQVEAEPSAGTISRA